MQEIKHQHSIANNILLKGYLTKLIGCSFNKFVAEFSLNEDISKYLWRAADEKKSVSKQEQMKLKDLEINFRLQLKQTFKIITRK